MNEEQLKQTYRALLKKYHPDTGGANADETIIRRLIEEYKQLSKHHKSEPPQSAAAGMLSQWSVPTDEAAADQFILEMIGLIAKGKTRQIPLDIVNSAAERISTFCEDDQKALTLTAIAELSRLHRYNETHSPNVFNAGYQDGIDRLTSYAKSICEATTYLERLSAAAKPKPTLIRDILRDIKMCDTKTMQDELNVALVLVVTLEL